AVPCALSNDDHHSADERERLWPALFDDVQGHRSLENINQLVRGMGLPMAFPGGLAEKEDPVAVGSQLRRTALTGREGRLRSPPAEHREFCGFCVQIYDVQHTTLHCQLSPFRASPIIRGL